MQFQRFDTIKKKHWSATTVAAIVRDEIYIGTRIWGKTRCSMHTGHKAVLNDETEWVRLENHHTAIIDRAFSAKRNRASTEMLRCLNQWRSCVPKSGDPAGTAGGEYPWACPSVCSVNVGKRKESILQQAMRLQRNQYRRIAKIEPTIDFRKDETL